MAFKSFVDMPLVMAALQVQFQAKPLGLENRQWLHTARS